jgi:hypothetical protein
VTEGDEPTDPQNDPDFISEEGVGGAFVRGPGRTLTGMVGSPHPVFAPKESTPLQEDGESIIPTFALWAMKYRRHGHLLSRVDVEIREGFGTGDHAVYVIDDGRKHCMVGRKVGTSPDGCTYCLVAQITVDAYDRLVADDVAVEDIFVAAREFALCAVFEAEQAVSNVTLVQTFTGYDEVPPEYLPPSPSIEFTEVLDDLP